MLRLQNQHKVKSENVIQIKSKIIFSITSCYTIMQLSICWDWIDSLLLYKRINQKEWVIYNNLIFDKLKNIRK